MFTIPRDHVKTLYLREELTQHRSGHVLKAPFKVERILQLDKFDEDDIVLDVGCARGYVLDGLASRIRFGVGVDINVAALEKAKRRDRTGFILCDAEELPLRDETFSKTICLDILEHSENPNRILREIKRVLSEGQKLLVQVPSSGLVGRLLPTCLQQGHLRYYTIDKICEELVKNGFVISDVKTYNSVPFSTLMLTTKKKRAFQTLSILLNKIPSKSYLWFGSILIKALKTK